jgi:hypothetical protein
MVPVAGMLQEAAIGVELAKHYEKRPRDDRHLAVEVGVVRDAVAGVNHTDDDLIPRVQLAIVGKPLSEEGLRESH